METYKFQISLPSNSTMTYIYHDEEKAKEKRQEFLDMDERFNPSKIESFTPESKAILVNENDKKTVHDTSGLCLVGKRKVWEAGVEQDQVWYSSMSDLSEVKKEFERTKHDPVIIKENAQKSKTRIKWL